MNDQSSRPVSVARRRTDAGPADEVRPGRATGASGAGFALPVAIFALVMVGLLVTGGFFVAQQESRISSATQQGTRAFYFAERGIAEVVDGWDNLRFTGLSMFASDTVNGTADGAAWEVEVRRIGTQLFFLASQAEITEGGQYAGASRRLGMVMRILTIDLEVPGAVTTRGDVTLSGNAIIQGSDQTPPGWGDACSPWSEDRPGVTTTPGSDVTSSGNSTVEGNPPDTTDASIDEETFTVFGELTWDELVQMANHSLAGGTLDQVNPRVADGECDTAHSLNWGDPIDPTAPCWSYFPAIHINGDATLAGGGVGQGLLLVEGDLHLEGGFNYHGVIVAQGAVTASGGGANAPTVHGGVLAANVDLESQGYTGASTINYSSCAVQRALAGLNDQLVEPRPIEERTWVDLSSIAFF